MGQSREGSQDERCKESNCPLTSAGEPTGQGTFSALQAPLHTVAPDLLTPPSPKNFCNGAPRLGCSPHISPTNSRFLWFLFLSHVPVFDSGSLYIVSSLLPQALPNF